MAFTKIGDAFTNLGYSKGTGGKVSLSKRSTTRKGVTAQKRRSTAGQKRIKINELRVIDDLGSPDRDRMPSPKMKAWTGGRSYGPTYTMTVQTRGKKPTTKRYR